jgi:hypothetical protein
MENPKFCKNCVFAGSDDFMAKCYKQVNVRIDDTYYVTGDIKYKYTQLQVFNCVDMRSNEKLYCGKEAKSYLDIMDKNSFEHGVIQAYWSQDRKKRIKALYRKEILKSFFRKIFNFTKNINE